MYGLNDQVCFVPLDAYLEQYEYVARRLADDLDADTVFMHRLRRETERGRPEP